MLNHDSSADDGAAAPRHQLASGGAIDMPRIAAAVREILIAIGEDPDREGIVDTPARVAKMYAET